MRNVLASGQFYGEVALAAVIIAIIREDRHQDREPGVNTVADTLYAMPNSNVKSIKDLVGKKMAITSPKGVADMLSIMVLEASGIPLDQVERPALGSIGAGLTALESGSVQAAGIIDPIWSARKDRYRALFYVKDVLPPMNQMVGITTSEFARAQPQKVRAIIAGRRMGVDYLYANPKESAQSIAKAYNLKPEVMEIAVNNLVAFRYWSRGEFDLKGMNEMVRGLKIIGEVKGEIDWDKIIDRSFLPADLRGGS